MTPNKTTPPVMAHSLYLIRWFLAAHRALFASQSSKNFLLFVCIEKI